MKYPWFCRQCGRLVMGDVRSEHLWDHHQVMTLDVSLNRFFVPAWN